MLPRRYRGAAVACCHCWPARHEGTVRAPRRCRQGDEPDDIGEVSRHEGYGLVPIWCRDGVATAACVLRVQRRWGLLVRHVLCGSAPWLLKERAPICSSEWAECLHVRYIANLCQDCTNSPAPADIDMNEPSDEILTIDEVAAYLKAGRRTVYRLAANGQIPAFKLGGTWRFRRTELDRWIAGRIDTHGRSKPDGVET